MKPEKHTMQAPIFVYNVNWIFKLFITSQPTIRECAPTDKNQIDLEKPTSQEQMPSQGCQGPNPISKLNKEQYHVSGNTILRTYKQNVKFKNPK